VVTSYVYIMTYILIDDVINDAIKYTTYDATHAAIDTATYDAVTRGIDDETDIATYDATFAAAYDATCVVIEP
jgi:hypothetical protein